jgi:hypothetical protein
MNFRSRGKAAPAEVAMEQKERLPVHEHQQASSCDTGTMGWNPDTALMIGP